MSFLKDYMHARAMASSPAYAKKYQGKAEAAQRDEFMTKLMGQQAQPAQQGPMQGPMPQGQQGMQRPQVQKQPAQEGTGMLGGQVSNQEAALRMMNAPTAGTRGVGQQVMKGLMEDQSSDDVSFAEYQSMDPKARAMYNKYEGLNETVPSDVLNDQYFRSLGDGSGELSQKQETYLLRKRNVKELDLETGYQNVVTGDFTPKQTRQHQINMGEGKDVARFLTDYPDDMRLADQTLYNISETRGALAELSGMTDYKTTGFMDWLNIIPTSDQMAWDNLKTTIESRLGLEKLLEMKASSPTGASGFGALSEKELKLLTANLGMLNQASDPKEIKRIIKRVVRQLDRKSSDITRKRDSATKRYKKNRGTLPEGAGWGDEQIEEYTGVGRAPSADPAMAPAAPAAGGDLGATKTKWGLE